MPTNDWTLSNPGQFIAGMARSYNIQSNCDIKNAGNTA